MAGIIELFKQKVSIDYQEWKAWLISKWNVQRDGRDIRRAIRRAKMKAKNDHKTYYIMRDKLGGINELNRSELNFFKSRGLFWGEDCKKRFDRSIAIVDDKGVKFTNK